MARFEVSRATWAVLVILLMVTSCQRTADLGETSWELVAYGTADAPVTADASVTAEAPASIRFDGDGRVSGFTGCNEFFGNYEASDGRLAFRDNEIAFTTRDCHSESGERAQDDFFRDWLGLGAGYSQMEEKLTLSFDEGRQVAEYRLIDQ